MLKSRMRCFSKVLQVNKNINISIKDICVQSQIVKRLFPETFPIAVLKIMTCFQFSNTPLKKSVFDNVLICILKLNHLFDFYDNYLEKCKTDLYFNILHSNRLR